MSWYELLYRKIEMKYLGKKYCNYTARHGHDLNLLYRGGKSYYRFIVYECSICKKIFILDSTGFLEKV